MIEYNHTVRAKQINKNSWGKNESTKIRKCTRQSRQYKVVSLAKIFLVKHKDSNHEMVIFIYENRNIPKPKNVPHIEDIKQNEIKKFWIKSRSQDPAGKCKVKKKEKLMLLIPQKVEFEEILHGINEAVLSCQNTQWNYGRN